MSREYIISRLEHIFHARIRKWTHGDQLELDNGSKVTINPCEDYHYPSGSWYVSIIDAYGNKDRTLIVDEEGNILN